MKTMPIVHSSLGSPAESDLERCRAFLVYQLGEKKRPPFAPNWPPPGPAITISYQTGSGAHEIARQLAATLRTQEPERSPPWTVFDRQLVEKVLEEHHLPATLAKLMPEDRRSYLDDVLDEIIGLRPPSWQLVPLIIQSILHLADAGHVILVGRGASFITQRLPNMFHVRLIASLQQRIERVREEEKLSEKEAARFIARSDRGRGRYAKAYFHARVDNDLEYHLVLNTDRIPPAEAVGLLAHAARSSFQTAHVETRS